MHAESNVKECNHCPPRNLEFSTLVSVCVDGWSESSGPSGAQELGFGRQAAKTWNTLNATGVRVSVQIEMGRLDSPKMITDPFNSSQINPEL